MRRRRIVAIEFGNMTDGSVTLGSADFGNVLEERDAEYRPLGEFGHSISSHSSGRGSASQ